MPEGFEKCLKPEGFEVQPDGFEVPVFTEQKSVLPLDTESNDKSAVVESGSARLELNSLLPTLLLNLELAQKQVGV